MTLIEALLKVRPKFTHNFSVHNLCKEVLSVTGDPRRAWEIKNLLTTCLWDAPTTVDQLINHTRAQSPSAILRELQDIHQAANLPTARFPLTGICGALDRHFDDQWVGAIVVNLAYRWSHYTGNPAFPIPDPSGCRTPGEIYHASYSADGSERWSTATAYGTLRREFLEFCIDQLTTDLQSFCLETINLTVVRGVTSRYVIPYLTDPAHTATLLWKIHEDAESRGEPFENSLLQPSSEIASKFQITPEKANELKNAHSIAWHPHDCVSRSNHALRLTCNVPYWIHAINSTSW